MPSRTKRVRFETEYNSSFKAFDPEIYKSPLVAALIDDEPRKAVKLEKNKTPAGLKSNKFLKSAEPPLQSKYKTQDHHGTTSKTILNSEQHKVNTKNTSGSTDSRTKPKKNRALEFKAGLKPDISSQQTKFPVSEYQREFEWKKSAIEDSPLLNAEKIVFDSHTNIPRFVREKVPRETEYQSRFTAEERRRIARKERDEINQEDDNPPSAVKRLLQTSHNPDAPFFPHGGNRVLHTEYQANFASPKKYQYERGIWLGAKPPHLLPDDQSTAGSSERITNWFEEVLELRARARKYKTRAIEGNYFSREYLAQLDAELEQLYAERNEASHSRNRKKSDGTPSPPHSGELGRPRPHVKQAWGSNEESEDNDIDDGKKIYRDLNEQFKCASPDSVTASSHSEHVSHHSAACADEQNANNIQGTKPTRSKNVNKKLIRHGRTKAHGVLEGNTSLQDASTPSEHSEEHSEEHSDEHSDEQRSKDRVGPSLSKTANKKHSPAAFHKTNKPAQVIKDDAPLVQNISSGSEASSELSEETGTESKDGTYQSPDKFDINYIKGMHSNDMEAPSTSVRSNYGSESERLSRNEYENESCLSHSSFASQESAARQTLTHAKQRKAKFWQ